MSDDETTPSQSPGSEPEKKGRSRFAGLHARTYEMELLLSGAVVFGLAQLPPVVTAFFGRFHAGLGNDLRMMGAPLETYVVLSLQALLGAFLLHLILRAFWIGLLGLESVFPGGILWKNIKLGAHTIKRYQERVGPLARSIDRVDDLCSLIFSFGFLLVITFVYAFAVLAGSAVLAFLVSQLFLGGAHLSTVFWILVGVVLALHVVGAAIDRYLGPHLDPDGVPHRVLRGVVGLTFLVSPMRWMGPIQLTLQSNLSATRVTAVVFTLMMLLAATQLGFTFGDRGLLRLDNRGYYPPSLREHGVDPRHYRDRRLPSSLHPDFPSIQSEVVVAPYLELSLPYYPRRHNQPLADRCPDLDPLREEGFVFDDDSEPSALQVERAAACLGALFDVRLDDSPLPDLVYEFAIEPGTDLEAVMARIPVRGLGVGRHELLVVAPPRIRKFGNDTHESVRHLIPFWR